MSGEVVGWAMKQVTGSPTTKLVLVKLADNSNEEGVCWPSLALIIKHTELSERAVREHLRILETKGLIRTIPRKTDDDRNRSNVYRLMVNGGVGQEVPPPDAVPAGGARDGAPGAGKPAGGAPGDGAPGAPRTLTKLNRQNPQVNPASGDAPPKASRRRIGDYTPSDDAKTRATKYWERRGRPDLVPRVEEEVERFVAYHRSTGSRMEDWESAWQTWYSNAPDHHKAPPSGPNGRAPAPGVFEDANTRGWVKRLEVYYGKTGDDKGLWSPNWGPAPGKPGCRVPSDAEAAFRAGGNGHG